MLCRTAEPARCSLPAEEAERSIIALQAASATRWLPRRSARAKQSAMAASDASVSLASMDWSAAAPSTSQLNAATEAELHCQFLHKLKRKKKEKRKKKQKGEEDRRGSVLYLEVRRRGRIATREAGRG